jgi:hypothetical protein
MPVPGGPLSVARFAFPPDGSRVIVSVTNGESTGALEIDGLAWTHDVNAFRDRVCSFVSDGLIRDQWRAARIPLPYTRQCR